MKKPNHLFAVYCRLLTFFLLSLAGCTYSFTGTLPSHLKTIAIPVFENGTIKYGLETDVTQKVVEAFIQDNHLKVVPEGESDSILFGKIRSYYRIPFAYEETGEVNQDQITIGVEVTYRDLKEEMDLLGKKGIEEWGTYFLDTETEEKAIEEAIEKLARKILREVIAGV
ncbi:LptE family protein [candidate division TA06 bacterium]|nr:LptE family protein [candidate division TA06 bacterium]